MQLQVFRKSGTSGRKGEEKGGKACEEKGGKKMYSKR